CSSSPPRRSCRRRATRRLGDGRAVRHHPPCGLPTAERFPTASPRPESSTPLCASRKTRASLFPTAADRWAPALRAERHTVAASGGVSTCAHFQDQLLDCASPV